MSIRYLPLHEGRGVAHHQPDLVEGKPLPRADSVLAAQLTSPLCDPGDLKMILVHLQGRDWVEAHHGL